MSDDTKLKTEIATIFQDVGDAIAGVLDQLIKGNWQDDYGHNVRDNAQMRHLAGVLKALTDYRAANPWALELRAPPGGSDRGDTP